MLARRIGERMGIFTEADRTSDPAAALPAPGATRAPLGARDAKDERTR